MRIISGLIILTSVLILFNNCSNSTDFSSVNSALSEQPSTLRGENSDAQDGEIQPNPGPAIPAESLQSTALLVPFHYVISVDRETLVSGSSHIEVNLPIFFRDLNADQKPLEIAASWRLASQFVFDQSYNRVERFTDFSLSWSNFLLKNSAEYTVKPSKVNEYCDTSALCSWRLRVANLQFGDHGYVRFEVNIKVKGTNLDRKFLIDFVFPSDQSKRKTIVIPVNAQGRPAENTVVAESCDLRNQFNDSIKTIRLEWAYRRASSNTHFQFFADIPQNSLAAVQLQDQEKSEIWDMNVFRGVYYRTKLILKCTNNQIIVDGYSDYDPIPESLNDRQLDLEYSGLRRSLCGTNNCIW